jgi:hypothetical protein
MPNCRKKAFGGPTGVATAFSRLPGITAKIIILSQFSADSCLTGAAKGRMDVEDFRVDSADFVTY